MIKVIFFDLGGVIFQDFFSGGAEFFAKKLKLSAEKVSEAYIKSDSPLYSQGRLTDAERWNNFAKEMGKVSPEKISQFTQVFYESYQLFPQSVTFLTKIKKEFPLLRLGVLSDQPISIAKYLRTNFPQIFSLFEENLIIISAEVNMSKKDPDGKIYRESIQRASEEPENILFIDNSLENTKHAQKFGINGFFFDILHTSIPMLTSKIEKLL